MREMPDFIDLAVLKLPTFAHNVQGRGAPPMAKPDPTTADSKRIYELEDELKLAKQRITELKQERDEAQALVAQQDEQVHKTVEILDSWKEAFEMELDDDGLWQWQSPLLRGYDELRRNYTELLKDWNRLIPKWNAHVAPKDVGRPLAASDAQVMQVFKLRDQGVPYRLIVDETGLGMQTVRTILGRKTRTDRTSKRRLERVDPDRAAMISYKARKRTRDALPKRITEALADGAELIKAAKGLGKR
jgi:hypothetical protein